MRRYKRYLEDDEVSVPRSTKYHRDIGLAVGHNEIEPNLNFCQNHQAVGLGQVLDNTCNAVAESDNEQLSSDNDDDEGTNSVNEDQQNQDDQEAQNSDDQRNGENNEERDSDNETYEEFFEHAQNLPAEDYIYRGALITRTQSSALILSYAIRHHITEVALRDLLHLINAHTPTVIHQSKYYFLQDLKEDKVQHHFFCEDCNHSIKFNNVIVDQCNNLVCSLFGKDQNVEELKKKHCFFIHLPLAGQLAELLNKPEIFAKLSQNHDNNGISSGIMYRDLKENGRIGVSDITLQFNTDGASAAKSSKRSIWPLQVGVNELPLKERKDNIILTSLWEGPKPHMNTFLRPFVDELEVLHSTGIVLDDGRLVKVHCVISSVDSVARPLLQNTKQFNGDHGCSFCLLPGERIERGNGMSRVYRGDVGDSRTEEQHMEDVAKVVNDGLDSSNGVKGPSLLLLIPIFNIITSFVPDYMHNVLLGVVRWFIFEWVDGKNSAQPWYLGGRKMKLIDKRLTEIKPPSEITRPPRSLDDRKLWKASEFKSFLVYYSIPCLKDILPDKYLRHWLLLVFALTTMLKEKCDEISLNHAERALRNFVFLTEDLYGKEWMTYNLHTMLHLPESVKNWGAPWDSSTFMFEHFNGVLLKLFSGTQHISGQIFKNYRRAKIMNFILNSNPYQHWHIEAGKLIKNLSGKYLNLNATRMHNLVLFGAGTSKRLTLSEQIAIENLLHHNIRSHDVRSYKRSISRGIKLHAIGYTRLSKRENSTVRLRNNTFVEIQDIVDMCDDTLAENNRCILLCRQLAIINNDICSYRGYRTSKFIKCVDTENSVLVAVLSSQIVCKCVKMIVNGEHFISDLVNSYERD